MHDLVGTDEAELAADQLLGEIGIGMARIEQMGAVGEPRSLRLELGELAAFDGLLPAVIAPGEHAVRADDGGAEEVGDDRASRPPASAARRMIIERIAPHASCAWSQNQRNVTRIKPFQRRDCAANSGKPFDQRVDPWKTARPA